VLSPEALHERMWESFPVLRQALETEQVPDRYCGLTSVSTNMFEELQRAATLVVLVKEFGPQIVGVANLVGKKEMHRDLENLRRLFEHERSLFDDGIQTVRKLTADL